MLPIGIQPQLQVNPVFAEINSQGINEVPYFDRSKSSSNSSITETKSNSDVNVKNPFDFTIGNGNDKAKIVTIMPDIQSDLTSAANSQVVAQSSNEVYADFNGDGFDDLAIGAWAEDIRTENDEAGAVNILYGSSNGLSATSPRSDQFWTQSTTDVNDISEIADFFGASLG